MNKKELRNEVKGLIGNAPMPYYCRESIGEEIFKEVKKDYPEASYHKKTGFLPAICMDDFSRFILAMQLNAISKYCLYYSANALVDSQEIMLESNLIRKNMAFDSFTEEGEE